MALDVNMPDTPFENFDEFHAWYLGEVDKNLPVSIQEVLNSGSPSSYSAMLPHWSDEQEAEIYAYVEKMVSFPDDVYLEYAPDSHTIYSRWDTEDGVYRIALNTPMYFFMAYPPILKAGMVHEFGHIFNGDCLNHIPCHGQCSNICCDVRINAGIEERTLDELYSAIFYVKGECPFTPSRWYPKYALPVNEAGWPFEIAHNAYHRVHPEDDCTPPEEGEGGEGGEGQGQEGEGQGQGQGGGQGSEGREGGEGGEGGNTPSEGAEKAKNTPVGTGGGGRKQPVEPREGGEGEEGEGQGQGGEEGGTETETSPAQKKIQEKIAKNKIKQDIIKSIEGLEALIDTQGVTEKERGSLKRRIEAFETLAKELDKES